MTTDLIIEIDNYRDKETRQRATKFNKELFSYNTPTWVEITDGGHKYSGSIARAYPSDISDTELKKHLANPKHTIRSYLNGYSLYRSCRSLKLVFDDGTITKYSTYKKTFTWLQFYSGPSVMKTEMKVVDSLGTEITEGAQCSFVSYATLWLGRVDKIEDNGTVVVSSHELLKKRSDVNKDGKKQFKIRDMKSIIILNEEILRNIALAKLAN